MKVAIIVHGGAGAWDQEPIRLQEAQNVCKIAAIAGQSLLVQGGSALDAVETAVRHLEDSPYLNAGRGSHPNAQGFIEMDALIMDGRTLNLGAVAAVQRIKNPISLARQIFEQEDFNFLAGAGAEEYAEFVKFPRCELSDLLVDSEALMAQHPSPTSDTVGAVALDAAGNLASATSTGGTRNKQRGRVGDSPLIGSGGYADNLSAAVSATGRGEDLMKILISKQVCDYVANGLPIPMACQTAITMMEQRVRGKGGLIAVDTKGQVGFAYNTFAMPYAYAKGNDAVSSGC